MKDDWSVKWEDLSMSMAKALQVTKENRGNYFATVGKLLGIKGNKEVS